MNALFKKIVDNDAQILPVTHSDGVYVGPNMTLTEKLEDVSGGYGIYVIDLEKWGITEGIPSKPYTRMHFLKANQNIKGINAALQYASENNFTEVIMPKGNYALCYPDPIQMRSYVTFNANGARFKVIYDSDQKSPFHNLNTTNYYESAGECFEFTDQVRHAHLKNMILEGDKYDRSFNNLAYERWIEWTTGVVFRKGASYCSVTHCKISGFMADNVTIVSGNIEVGFPNKTLNDISADGTITASTNTLLTDYITIPRTDMVDISMTTKSLGYSYLTGLTVREFDVAFYKEDNTFIGLTTKRKIYSTIQIPLEAKKLRVKFYNETDPAKNMWSVVVFGNTPVHNKIQYNDLFYGHRGGIQPGGSYNEISNNLIHENGLGADSYQDGKPTFPDSTRYQINQEDSFGDGTVIRDNVLWGGTHGILIRNYNSLIENNIFYNHSGSAVNVYPLQFFTAKGNYFYRCGRGISQSGSGFSDSHMHIYNNSFIYSPVDADDASYQYTITGNNFIDSSLTTLDNALVQGNQFKRSSLTGDGMIQGNFFYDDSGASTVWLQNLSASRLSDCTFKNVNVRALGKQSGGTGRYNMVFKDCRFINGLIETQATAAGRETTYEECEFIDSQVRGWFSTSGAGSTTYSNVVNCKMYSNVSTLTPLYVHSNGADSVWITVEGTKFFIKTNLPSLVTTMYASTNAADITIKNCELEYNGTTPLALTYLQTNTLSNIKRFVYANNKIKNLAFGELSGSKYKFYDPDDFSESEPSSGYFTVGQKMYNALPVAGGSIGWICTVQGHASTTAWGASTSYTVGQQVNTGTKVYYCTVAGTTGTTAPTHSTGTATDGTVTWMYLGSLAVFKQFGLISE